MGRISYNNDQDMIKHPDAWPQWPYLPVKRRKGAKATLECGVIYEGTGIKTVRVANLFALPTEYQDFLTLPKYEYDSVDALLADGWVVD